jgi:hypothetical protein
MPIFFIFSLPSITVNTPEDEEFIPNMERIDTGQKSQSKNYISH